MTKPVVSGEPLLPALNATWYNNTLRKPSTPSPVRRGAVRDATPLVARFEPSIEHPVVERFDPVGLDARANTYDNHRDRTHTCSIEALNRFNWIIPQGKMSEDIPTQPCVYWGVTYANVVIRNEDHHFVDLDEDTNQLVSSNEGKGQILVGANENESPQLILIGVGNFTGQEIEEEPIEVPINVSLTSTHLEFDLIKIWVVKKEETSDKWQIPLTRCEDEEEPE